MSEPKDPLELDERCVECGRRYDDPAGHMLWCTRFLSPKDAEWAGKQFIKEYHRPICDECQMPGWHLETCSKFLPAAVIANRKRLAEILISWERQHILTKWAARALAVAIEDGQEVDLYRDIVGHPRIVWGWPVEYSADEYNKLVAEHSQQFN